MKKLSKKLYLGLIIGAYSAGMVCIIVGVIMITVVAVVKGEKFTFADVGLLVPGIVFLLLGMALAFMAAIVGYVILYKAWQAIQDGQPRTTPGKAVGYLFIPFFNLYWMFVAYWGWAKDCNAYISSKGLSLAPIPEKLYLAYPIIILCSGIPYVGSVAGMAIIVIFIIMSIQMMDTVNGIYDARMNTTVTT
jgi:divalent metal cation (Fe/Co/Zn/Cd) transporter